MVQDLSSAISLLKKYSTITPKIVDSETEKQNLRSAVKLIVSLADAQNFGICASNAQEALDTLDSYLQALGYKLPRTLDTTSDNNSVYLKFSTERMSYKIEPYDGKYRGVLITIFSTHKEDIVGTYGHLPINLFTEKASPNNP
jgi:hypothetical protein